MRKSIALTLNIKALSVFSGLTLVAAIFVVVITLEIYVD